MTLLILMVFFGFDALFAYVVIKLAILSFRVTPKIANWLLTSSALPRNVKSLNKINRRTHYD